ncbi:MAG: AraC family transcriptional regulator [Myxococcales bacterium]|nr:AraC family transcriptional regulator [Myxococcales bacterium]
MSTTEAALGLRRQPERVSPHCRPSDYMVSPDTLLEPLPLPSPRRDPPRGVLSPTGPREGIAHRRFWVSGPLSEQVEHLWSVEWSRTGLGPYRARTLPHPSVHLVASATAGGAITSEVVWVQRGPFERTLSGTGWALGVKFVAAGFGRRRAGPAAGRGPSPLAVVLPEAAVASWHAALAGAPDVEARVLATEAWLRAFAPPMTREARAVRDMVALARDTPALTRAEDLAARAGVSLRTLERRFAAHLGVSPKWVIARYRLHEALAQLARVDRASLSALAASLGFADQAHFTRSFKALVGLSPTAYQRAQTRA